MYIFWDVNIPDTIERFQFLYNLCLVSMECIRLSVIQGLLMLFLFVVLGLLNLQVLFIEDVNMSTKVLKSFSAVEKLDVTSENFFYKAFYIGSRKVIILYVLVPSVVCGIGDIAKMKYR